MTAGDWIVYQTDAGPRQHAVRGHVATQSGSAVEFFCGRFGDPERVDKGTPTKATPTCKQCDHKIQKHQQRRGQ